MMSSQPVHNRKLHHHRRRHHRYLIITIQTAYCHLLHALSKSMLEVTAGRQAARAVEQLFSSQVDIFHPFIITYLLAT